MTVSAVAGTTPRDAYRGRTPYPHVVGGEETFGRSSFEALDPSTG